MEGVSRTAVAVAVHRARHRLLDDGRFYGSAMTQQVLEMTDSELCCLEGNDKASKRERRKLASPKSRKVRFFLCIRAKLSVQLIQEAIAASKLGLEAVAEPQVVLLGAGLDLMFYENGFDAAPLFEMDCMPTQSWKRTRLDQLKVSTSHVTFVECDLEVDDLASCLERKGFDPARKTIYVWLGVVSYLKRETVEKVLAQMQNAVVIFDYSEPPSRDKQFEKRAKHVAELGEPWRTFFLQDEVDRLLKDQLGFSNVVQYGPSELAKLFFDGSCEWVMQKGLCRIVCAEK